MRAVDEWTGRIVNGDEIGRLVRQRLEAIENGMLPADAAQHRGGQSESIGRRRIESFVPGGDHHPHVPDAGTGGERIHRVAEDGFAAQNGVLLGNRTAKAGSTAGGDDEGDASWHSVLITLA